MDKKVSSEPVNFGKQIANQAGFSARHASKKLTFRSVSFGWRDAGALCVALVVREMIPIGDGSSGKRKRPQLADRRACFR